LYTEQHWPIMKAKMAINRMTETVIDLGFCRSGTISEALRPHRTLYFNAFLGGTATKTLLLTP